MAWNLHAIEQIQLWGRRRVHGVGRPNSDFHPGTCCCAGEGLFNTKLTGPGEVFLQSYSHGKFKNYAIEWYLGNRASAGLARFASRGGAAADPFGAPPAADTEVIQRRGNHAPAPVPAAAPMDRKGR